MIELMEDDPEALKFVIRHLYGFSKVSFDNFPAIDESWRFWLALHTTADKYLEPDLSEQALKEFRTLARFQTDPNEVASIIRVVKTEMDHNGPLADIATAMLKKHLGPLLEYEDFREWLGGEKNMMLDMLWELSFAGNLVERQVSVCKDTVKSRSLGSCTTCNNKNVYNYGSCNGKANVSVWMRGETRS